MKTSPIRFTSVWRLILGCLATMTCLPEVHAQVYEKVFSFTEAKAAGVGIKGRQPKASLAQGSDGNFYGTTYSGGASNNGTVFKMTPAGEVTTLVEFTGNTGVRLGASPSAALVQGPDGRFYGTTEKGGASDNGTIFKMTSTGVMTTLVSFSGNTGSSPGSTPKSALVLGNDGCFYGTTESGGTNDFGTVFKVTPTGVFTSLVSFTDTGVSNQGSRPQAGLTLGSDGNFYGTTKGGINGSGTIFKMTPDGTLTTLVSFTGNGVTNKGRNPFCVLVIGPDGNFYGTTAGGGANDGGTVFKMTPSGTLTTLVSLTRVNNNAINVFSGLTVGSDGSFYGTSERGGNDHGTVFRLTPDGILSTVARFSSVGPFGREPVCALIQASDGSFYGTNQYGGVAGGGTVFKMSPVGTLSALASFGNVLTKVPTGLTDELVQNVDGSFYGVTRGGGENDMGTVFRVSPDGTVKTLVDFVGSATTMTTPQPPTIPPITIHTPLPNQGKSPLCLVKGADGNFYGTTELGGATSAGPRDKGTIFKMTPEGALTTLVVFTNTADRVYSLTLGSDGNFYGTGQGGTNDCGLFCQMKPVGTLTRLVNFTGTVGPFKGAGPCPHLVQGGDGSFYGTTRSGGGSNLGTIFKITTDGSPAGTTLTTLVEFTGANGSDPEDGLVQGSDGSFYGTTQSGGSNLYGTIFRMTTNGTPGGTTLTTLVNFTFEQGIHPYARLVQGPDGNLYGTTSEGGLGGVGTVFKMTPQGALSVVYDFAADEVDSTPHHGLILASDGNLYGTTQSQDGSIYRLICAGAPNVYLSEVQPQADGSVLLRGKMNARGSLTTVTLEYGTDGINFPSIVNLRETLNKEAIV